MFWLFQGLLTEDDEVLEWLIIQRSGADETVSYLSINSSIFLFIYILIDSNLKPGI